MGSQRNEDTKRTPPLEVAECEQVEWLRWWWLVLGKKEVSGKVFGKKGALAICRVAKAIKDQSDGERVLEKRKPLRISAF